MSFYDDASLVFLAGGAAGKDGKVYNLKPQPNPVSGELITNGSFDTDSDWTKVGESTISGGKGNVISTAGVWSNLSQNNVFTVGKHYRVALDATVNINGEDYAIKIQDGSADANIGKITTSGSYVFYFTAGATTLTIARYSTTSAAAPAVDVDVDNVSVVEVESIPADFTFTRGSNLSATRVGPDGFIEKGRENLLLQSNTFNTTWSTPSASIVGGQTGYDGSSDAWLLTQIGVGGYVRQFTSASGVSTASVYVKAGSTDWVSLELESASPNPRQYFQLVDDGVKGIDYGSAYGVIDAKIYREISRYDV